VSEFGEAEDHKKVRVENHLKYVGFTLVSDYREALYSAGLASGEAGQQKQKEVQCIWHDQPLQEF
jgi:hypothetical protein